MKRNSNYHVESVNTPEDLKQFESLEIRKIHAGNSPGIILQNPDTGERCKLIISKVCFGKESLKISRKTNLCDQLNI